MNNQDNNVPDLVRELRDHAIINGLSIFKSMLGNSYLTREFGDEGIIFSVSPGWLYIFIHPRNMHVNGKFFYPEEYIGIIRAFNSVCEQHKEIQHSGFVNFTSRIEITNDERREIIELLTYDEREMCLNEV